MPRNTPTTLQKATLPVGENEGELTTRIVRLDQRFVTKLGPSDERYRITDARSTGLSIRMEPSGNHTWQVRVPSQEGARQIWQTLGKVADIPVRRARRLASDTRKIAADDPNSRKALGKDRAQKLPFEELAEEWMDTYVARKKPGTQTSYQEKLDLYILPRFRNHKLRQMDTAAIRAWHEDITAKGVCAVQKDSTRKPRQAARSADVALGTFASFFRFAIQEGWIVSNPTRDVPHNGDHKIHRPMDGNARRKAGQTIRDMMVDGSANPIHLMAVQVSMATSLRREALTSLEWREVDLERRFIRLETKNTTTFDPQYIPIGSAAYTILRGIPRIGDSPYVFPGRNPNRPMAPGTLNAVWNKIRERAGIYGDYPEQDRYGKTIEKPPIRPHDLRHTKAAKLAETNENAMVGALVGIKTTSMIDRYGGPGKKKKEEVNEGYETCLAEDLGIDVDPEFFEGDPRAVIPPPQRVQIVVHVGSWPHRAQPKRSEPKAEDPLPRATKGNYPPDEVLQEMVLTRPVSVIGPELGVTAKALEKHCKARGLKVRPRGYWAKKRAAKASKR